MPTARSNELLKSIRSETDNYDMKQLNSLYNLAALDFSRVTIIGCPGSGKTTFTKSFGEILSRPIIHLDKMLWGANWQMLPYDERQVIHNELVSADSWIIDGMWRSHLPERLDRATTVIFLDYKRGISMCRAINRRIKFRGKQRDDIADGCLEKLDNYFLNYIWTFRRKVRPFIIDSLATRSQLQVVTFRNPRQTKRFLSELESYIKTLN